MHKNLEVYRIPKGLEGKQTHTGIVLKRLCPIFRDREELPTSPELGDAIYHALKDSSHFTVNLLFPMLPSMRSVKTAIHDNSVKTWDAETRKQLIALEGYKERLSFVAFSLDGYLFVTASYDKKVKIWDTET